MVNICAVVGCKSTSKDANREYKFHVFPKDVQRCRVWEKAAGTLNTGYSCICSLHFEDSEFTMYSKLMYPTRRQQVLTDTAVPTLLLPDPIPDFSEPIQYPDIPLAEHSQESDRKRIIEEAITYFELSEERKRFELEYAYQSAKHYKLPEIGPLAKNCRLCLSDLDPEDTSTRKLFEKAINENDPMSDQLMLFFALSFEETPGWPSVVCRNCVNFISQMKAFKDKVISTHKTLYNTIVKGENLPRTEETQEQTTPLIKQEPISIQSEAISIDTEPISNESEAIPIGSIKPKRERLTAEEEERLEQELISLNVLRCSECDTIFPSLTELITHQRSTHNSKYNSITCCNMRWSGLSRIYKHTRYHLNPDIYKCETCGERLKSPCGLKLHRRKHVPVDDRPFSCPHCPKKFRSKTCVPRHIERMHDKKVRYICDICGSEFHSLATLSEHRRLEKVRKIPAPVGQRQICSFCGKSVRHIKKHMQRFHISLYIPTETEKSTFKDCEICGKSVNEYLMIRHKVSHSFNQCSICGKEFTTRTNYVVHMDKHRNRKFPCEHCSKILPTANSRYLHFRSQHPKEFEERRSNS